MSERKYTESEIRAKWRALYGDGKIPAALFEPFIKGLTGPRLKPDFPVIDGKGDVWMGIPRNAGDPPFTPLIRADRVMEWAREYDAMDEAATEYFARRIREETEVSDE